ncbi:MAG: GTP cyclohydrolase, FolE2/MptA family [Fervidicoccaceae archaeon]
MNKAGISNLYVEAHLELEKSCHEYTAILNIYTDLPADKRGVHLSRLVNAALSELNRTCLRIEDFLSNIAKKILATHQYSSFAEVETKITIPRNGQLVSIEFKVRKKKTGEEEWRASVEIMGATSCPCAKEVFRFYEGTEWNHTPTHMQRAMAKAILDGSKTPLTIEEALEVISVIESSFSGILPVSLSRDEEKELIKKVINNPMFAEDLAREIAVRVSKTEAGRKSRDIIAQVNSLESIHPFNVYAEVHFNG